MIWILIIIAVVAIIVFSVKKSKQNKEERKRIEEENKKHIQECAKDLNEKWALCLSKFVHDDNVYREPCIIRIMEVDGKRTALRITRKSSEIEKLFEVTDEEANDSGSYQWTGMTNGVLGAILIDVLDKDDKEKHPDSACELCVSIGDKFDFYITTGFMDDAETAIKLINKR